MFKVKKIASIIALSTSLITANANASLVSIDWQVANDNLVVLDEATGIEWLDLTETSNQSYNTIQSRIDTGDLMGWRLPTRAEVLQLMQDAFPSKGFNATDHRYEDSGSESMNFHQLFTNSTTAPYAYGVYKNDTQATLGGPDYYMSGTYYGTKVEHLWGLNWTQDTAHYAYSPYVVNDGGVSYSSILNPMLNINNLSAPINQVPVGLGLGSLALLGLFGFRKIKSNK